MLNKLLVFGLAVIILQTAVILPYAYSQTNIIEGEFYLLCKEVLLGLLSDANGQRILKGETPQPDDPTDMNLSFTWWESSAIFQQSRMITGGLWNQLNPNWGMTYGQKYEEITVLPSLEGLEKLTSLDISETVSTDPRIEDIPVERKPVTLMIPNITWTPGTTWERAILSYDGKKLSGLGTWHHPQEEKWWRDALISAAWLTTGLILNRYPETIVIDPVTKKEFAEWPPIAPECWTACAEGEPIYNRPPLPDTQMSIDEWEKGNWARWYLTPSIIERIISPGDKKTSWTAYGRYVAFAVSIDFAGRALQKALIQKEQFPE